MRREYFSIIFNVKKCTLYLIKYGIFSIHLAFSSGLGQNFLPSKTKFNKKLQGFFKILRTFTKFFKISQYIITYYLDFIELWCVSVTFGFAFGAFKSLPQHFSLFRNGSKFQNFRLHDGEGWKSLYRRYLLLTHTNKNLASLKIRKENTPAYSSLPWVTIYN